LHCSALKGNKKSVEVLLKYVAIVDVQGKCNETPLLLCLSEKHSDNAEVLLMAGAYCSRKSFFDKYDFNDMISELRVTFLKNSKPNRLSKMLHSVNKSVKSNWIYSSVTTETKHMQTNRFTFTTCEETIPTPVDLSSRTGNFCLYCSFHFSVCPSRLS
jgi:ankyrin repeat protein